jgi:hypothetical protein
MAVHVDARGGPHLAQEGRGGLSGAVSVRLPHLALPGFQVDRRVLDDLRLQAWARRLAALQPTGGRTARRRSPACTALRAGRAAPGPGGERAGDPGSRQRGRRYRDAAGTRQAGGSAGATAGRYPGATDGTERGTARDLAPYPGRVQQHFRGCTRRPRRPRQPVSHRSPNLHNRAGLLTALQPLRCPPRDQPSRQRLEVEPGHADPGAPGQDPRYASMGAEWRASGSSRIV